MYNFLRYSEINFILYVNNFKKCVESLYVDVKKHLQYKDIIYLDLSMFEDANWEIFDPYTYVVERDKKYNSSWEVYIKIMKKKKKNKEQLKYVEMCKKFEDVNKIPLDLVCDYIVEQILQEAEKNIEFADNKKKIIN